MPYHVQVIAKNTRYIFVIIIGVFFSRVKSVTWFQTKRIFSVKDEKLLPRAPHRENFLDFLDLDKLWIASSVSKLFICHISFEKLSQAAVTD